MDSHSGKVLKKLDQQCKQADWSPDGKYLVVCNGAGWFLYSTRHWEVESKADAGHLRAIKFSRDGKHLAAGGKNGVVHVWDVATQEKLHTFRGHQGGVSSISWDPSGRRLASSDTNGQLKIWNLETSSGPRKIRSSGPVKVIRWHADGRTIAAIDANGGSQVWDSQNGQRVGAHAGTEQRYACPSPDGKSTAIVGSASETAGQIIELCDSRTRVRRGELKTKFTEISRMRWSSASDVLVVNGSGNAPKQAASFAPADISTPSRKGQRQIVGVEIWQTHEAQCVARWESKQVNSVAFSPDDQVIAVGAVGDLNQEGVAQWAPHVHVFDVKTGERIAKFRHRDDRDAFILEVAVSNNNRFVAAGDMNGFVEVREIATGRVVMSTQVHPGSVTALSWSPDDLCITSSSGDASVKLIVAATGQEVLELPTQGGWPMMLRWSPNGSKLAAAMTSGAIFIWDASPGYKFAESDRFRGHLALAYFERARHQSPSDQRSQDLQRAVALAPDTAEYRRFRADLFAEVGDYQAVVAEFDRAKQSGPRVLLPRTLSNLAGGEIESYRKGCEVLLERFGADPTVAPHVVRVCTLQKGAVAEPQRLVEVAQSIAATVSPELEDRLVLGEAFYRAGMFDEASDFFVETGSYWAEDADTGIPLFPTRASIFQAMTEYQLGRHNRARKIVELARRRAEDEQRDTTRVSWSQRLVLDRLLDESLRLIH